MSSRFSNNINRLSSGNIWLGSDLMIDDKKEMSPSCLNMSKHSSTSSSSTNSSVLSKINNMEYLNNLSRQSTISRSSSISMKKTYKSTTAQLKEYGKCYKQLGKGTSAVVMVVRQLGEEGQADKLYAIKQFRKKQKSESEKQYMKKLTSEFCISSTFNHPNIVETIDLVLDDKKRYCTVMEYCPGGDLFSCIMLERMTKLEKYCCFKQLLNGLTYLHSIGVAHRDIKPENLLLTMDGKLKITDFGVSDVFRFPWETKGRPSAGLVGSEPYIAPEAFELKEYWGPSVDIWSTGIVFYCLLMGGLAWHRAKKSEAAYASYIRSIQQPNHIFELFKSLTGNEKRILYLILNPNPNSRISAFDLLNDPWIRSIETCENNRDSNNQIHQHTNGIQPVCKLSSKK